MSKKSESRLGEQTTGGTTIRLSPFVRDALRKRYGRMAPNDAIAMLLEKDAPIKGESMIEIINAFVRLVPLSELAAALGAIGYDLESSMSADRGEIIIRAKRS